MMRALLRNVPRQFTTHRGRRNGTSSTQAGPLTADQRMILDALNEAAHVISEYLEASPPGHPEVTLDRLIELLGNQGLADAVDRLEAGFGLRVVK
jgi:hypothetical protein